MSDSLYYSMYELCWSNLSWWNGPYGKTEGVNSGKIHQETKAPILSAFEE